MTTASAILICKSLADKYGSAEVSNTDWTSYLDMAQFEVLNKLFPDTLGGMLNVETDSNTLEEIRPLIYPLTLIPSAGLLTNAQLNTALQAASGDSTCSIFRILNMSIASTGAVVRFIKHNDINTFKLNVFKIPTQIYPGYTLIATGYQISPSIAINVNVTCIKTPKNLTNTGETIDYGDYVVNQILFTTVKLAGVQVRDEQIAFDIRNTGIQSSS